MAAIFPKLSDGQVSVAPLNRFNWEQCLNLEVETSQQNFLPSILYSIAQSKFENCTPCGIFHKGDLCGFVMYCQFQQTTWVNRILIDRRFQRQGIAGKALQLLVNYLSSRPESREIRASFASENFAAERLFFSMGFVPIGDTDGSEIVLRFRG